MNEKGRQSNCFEKRMYAFYDTESQQFDIPFFADSDLHAKRHFRLYAEKEGTFFNKFKSKFDLVFVGVFDTENGIITASSSNDKDSRADISYLVIESGRILWPEGDEPI